MAVLRSSAVATWIAAHCDRFTARLDATFDALERRLGSWGASAAFAVVLLVVAAVYTAPAVQLVNHGILYGEVSKHPFDGSASPLRFRLLAPALAYVLFLRGNAFIAFPLITAAVFIAVVIHAHRARGYSGSDSIGIASLVVFTTPILFTLHFAGYVDTLSYLFIAIAVFAAGSDVVVLACIALGLLNHEASAFMVPFIVLRAWRMRSTAWTRARLLLGVAAAFAVVFAARHLIALQAPIEWSPGFYLNAAYLKENALLNVRGAWLGLFMVFKLHWVVPLLASIELFAQRRRAELFELVLAVAGGLATLSITSDESRLPAMAFPALFSAAALLRKEVLSPLHFGRALWCLVALNFLVPQYYVGQSKPIPFFPLPVALVLKALGYDPWSDWLGQQPMHFSQ